MRERCCGEGLLVKREKRNARMTCPECGARLSARTSPVRRARGFYNRVPAHHRKDRDDLIGATER